MATISPSLLTFLLNSIWQIPLVTAIAAAACWLLRNGPANHRHAIWVAGLSAAILLPLASIHRADTTDAVILPAPPSVSAMITNPAPIRTAPPPVYSSAPPRTISVAAATGTILLSAYLAFLIFRLALLGFASFKTLEVRRRARALEMPSRLDRVRARCEKAFRLDSVDLLFSRSITGPVTAGRAIILPESLLEEQSDDVLTTAVGHEMAHIARHDFACHLVYELLCLPVSFHPAAWLIRRGIERTREMACDEMVTRRLLDATIYARRLADLATAIAEMRRPGYTLGVFDGDILEERIRRLMERPAASLKRPRLLLAGGLAGLALAALVASSVSFTARAQNGAGDVMKQGQDAYNRGDYRSAAAAFDVAVRLNPDNLEAKLFLAKSLASQAEPGTDPNNSLVSGARKQYLDVLARDAGNKRALHGIMLLTTNTKQYEEAVEWARKAIQADPSDVAAYYTTGFLDWVMAYPDYMKARQSAGMQPQEAGMIPDPGVREAFRLQHLSQIEEGRRMLETALQQDPDDSDAMAYLNLLYRIESGIASSPAESDEMMSKANDWMKKALDAKRRQPRQRTERADAADELLPPPPPPPPPPPSRSAGSFPAAAPVRIAGSVQQGKLLKQTPPVYPPSARQAGISGTVRLNVTIDKNGAVKNITVVDGPAELVAAAMQAVQQWKYQPTLLNGEPVEVTTDVSVDFSER